LQTFVALYASWLEQRPSRRGERRSRPARLVRVIVIDFGVIAAIVAAAGVTVDRLTDLLAGVTGLAAAWARPLVVIGAFVLCSPFFVGMVRSVRALGRSIASGALPQRAGQADLGAAPRRALVVMLQLALLLMLSIPLVALTEPLISPLIGAIVLGVGLLFLGVSFWRSAENLQEHVRAVAHVVVEALANQAGTAQQPTLDQVQKLIPGMGDLTPVQLSSDSPAVGKTLAELNLRGLTGATVIAIHRGGEEVLIPTGTEELRVGDMLALAGAHDAVDAARQLLLPQT
jgi:CPA2 family monovalent cation:H+ antiporter-2